MGAANSNQMFDKPLLRFPKLEEGILLKRYKRFLADVELKSGEIVTAHCPNTGPMKSILHPGGRVRLRYCPSDKRKLSWTWEQAEAPSNNQGLCWVGVNTALPNKLVRLAIEAGCLSEEIGAISEIRTEVPYGKDKKSRIDLLLKPDKDSLDLRAIYLEVKNTTWLEGNIAYFPDTVTTRGQKHLRELIELKQESRGVLVPCISRSDVEVFAPGDKADPTYGKLFRLAMDSGVQIIPCSFGFFSDKITWEGTRSIYLHR